MSNLQWLRLQEGHLTHKNDKIIRHEQSRLHVTFHESLNRAG